MSELAEEDGSPALVDAPHWATEQPWLADAAAQLGAVLAARPGGDTVTVAISGRASDPWTLHVPSSPSPP